MPLYEKATTSKSQKENYTTCNKSQRAVSPMYKTLLQSIKKYSKLSRKMGKDTGSL